MIDTPFHQIDLQVMARQAMLDHGFEPEFAGQVQQQLWELKARPPEFAPSANVRDLRNMLWSSIDNDTHSDAAKANIKEGLRLHQIAGRPTRQQLTLVFGVKGYLLIWPKRTENFDITPETFQAALAKGVPAVPLAPVAKPTGENTKEST